MLNKLEKLRELYAEHKSKIYDVGSRCKGIMNGPFLISPNEPYWKAQTKILFIGQETNGWSCKDDISLQMRAYSKFNVGRKYNSTFFNVIRKIEKELTGCNFASAWLNLNRYDQKNKRPSWANQCILSELDFLLLDEIKLLSPDVIIFFTGPHYDKRIINLMGATISQVENYKLRQFATIKTHEINSVIFRTYHPKYLRISGLEGKIIDGICALTVTRAIRNH